MSKTDKKDIFSYYWNLFSLPKGYPTLLEEYKPFPDAGHKCDFKVGDYPIIVEVDGGQHAPGGGRHNSDKDRAKTNRLTSLGYYVFHFSPDALLNDPLACLAFVETLIDRLKLKDADD